MEHIDLIELNPQISFAARAAFARMRILSLAGLAVAMLAAALIR